MAVVLSSEYDIYRFLFVYVSEMLFFYRLHGIDDRSTTASLRACSS
jgi:hypothetical protein